jgi:nucleotide-binding universal stress UspA family protein
MEKINISKILVLIDFTPMSIKALDWAKDLAKKYGNAEIVLFHELEDVYTIFKLNFSFGLPVTPDLKEKEWNKAKEKLEILLKDIENGRYILEAEGKVEKRLPIIVDQENPDLVIIYEDYEDVVEDLSKPTLVIK